MPHKHGTEYFVKKPTNVNDDDKFQKKKTNAIGKPPSLLSAKYKIRVGCWNVRTLSSVGKLELLSNEMMKYGLDLIALSEVRRKGNGSTTIQMDSQTFQLLYSGGSKAIAGVGLLLNQRASVSLLGFEAMDIGCCLQRSRKE